MGEKETATAEEAERLKNKTKSNQSNDRAGTDTGGTLDPDSDDDGVGGGADPAASGDAERMQKQKTKSNQSNDRMAPDSDDDGVEAAINNTKSNIKNLADVGGGGATHEDDWEAPAAKLAPERPVRSE